MLKKLVLGSLLAAASLAASAEQYLIDVRSPEEFAEAHADGAINIPVDEVSQKISDITQDHDADIYVYCRSGRRATRPGAQGPGGQPRRDRRPRRQLH